MARLRYGQSIRPLVVFFMLTFSRAHFSNGVYGLEHVTSNKIVPQVDVESTKLTVDTSEPSKPIWQAPGCHRVGIARTISIPECVEFSITTNACRGFCLSYSVPSGPKTLAFNPKQVITSVGQCCNIVDTEDVIVRVMCLNGPRNLVFKSALSCGCFNCKKE